MIPPTISQPRVRAAWLRSMSPRRMTWGRRWRRSGSRTRPQPPAASPAALQPQAFGEIAAKIILAEMLQLALQVDPDFAADVAPAAAERVIFRQIAARIRVDHA